MKYVVEMGSRGMIYIQIFMKISSGVQRCWGRGLYVNTAR
jgi:hypothetical protein